MNKLLITALVASLSLSTASYADNDSGYYLGAGLHRANFDRGAVDSSDTKGNLSLGYMFNDNLGIDGTWYNFVNVEVEGLANTSASAKVTGIALTGIYKMPVSEKIDVYGKAGLIRTAVKINGDGITEVDESGSDFIVGLGVKYDFGVHNALLEYVKVDPTDASLDVVSLGYRFEF